MLAAIAALLVPLLGWIARTLVVSLVARVLVGFGVAFVAHKFLVGPILDAIKSNASGMPAEVLQWLGLLKFDVALTILCSAYVIRFSVGAMSAVKISS